MVLIGDIAQVVAEQIKGQQGFVFAVDVCRNPCIQQSISGSRGFCTVGRERIVLIEGMVRLEVHRQVVEGLSFFQQLGAKFTEPTCSRYKGNVPIAFYRLFKIAPYIRDCVLPVQPVEWVWMQIDQGFESAEMSRALFELVSRNE